MEQALKFGHELVANTEVLGLDQVISLGGSIYDVSGGTCYCRTITISIPVGKKEDDLFIDTTGVSIASHTPQWNAVSKVKIVRPEATAFVEVGLEYKGTKKQPLSEPVQFTIIGKVNNSLGTAILNCYVTYDTASTQGEEEQSEHAFIKGTIPFYLKNFITTTEASPLNTCSEFPASTPIRFQWEGTGTNYQLYQKGNSVPIYSDTQQSFVYTKGIENTTTFILQATRTANASKDAKEEKIRLGTQFLYDAITLTVTNPTIQTLTVEENVWVHGDITTRGDLSAEKKITAQSLNIDKAAWLNETRLLGRSDTDDLFVNGKLSLMGTTHLLGKSTRLPIELYVPECIISFSTDGLLMGVLDFYYDTNEPYGELSAGAVTGPVDYDNAYLARVSSTKGGEYQMNKSASVSLPIHANEHVTIMMFSDLPISKDWNYGWWFIPFGEDDLKGQQIYQIIETQTDVLRQKVEERKKIFQKNLKLFKGENT